jgi:hypothetical protein
MPIDRKELLKDWDRAQEIESQSSVEHAQRKEIVGTHRPIPIAVRVAMELIELEQQSQDPKK